MLGIFDLLAGFFLIFGNQLDLSKYILIVFGAIMIVKASLGILKDFASWVDFCAGLALITSSIIILPWGIGLILGLIVIQKGIFSFL